MLNFIQGPGSLYSTSSNPTSAPLINDASSATVTNPTITSADSIGIRHVSASIVALTANTVAGSVTLTEVAANSSMLSTSSTSTSSTNAHLNFGAATSTNQLMSKLPVRRATIFIMGGEAIPSYERETIALFKDILNFD